MTTFMNHCRSIAQESSRRLCDEPSIIVVQANLVLGLCELLTMINSKAWLHIGLAIRMAQALRMRRESGSRLTPHQREIRRRTFWSCVVLDRLVAYCGFRTQTIELALVELYLPCSKVAFAFERDSTGPSVLEIEKPGQMDAEPMALAYLLKTVILWSPIAKGYVDGGRRLQRPGSQQPPDSSVELDAAMRQWQNGLPVAMKWSEKNLYAHQALGQMLQYMSVHFLIEHATFVTHHEHLPSFEARNTSDGNEPVIVRLTEANQAAIAICRQGARNIVAMLGSIDVATKKTPQMYQSIYIGIPMMTAASVLLWICHIPVTPALDRHFTPADIVEARAQAEYLLSIFDAWADSWDLAKSCAQCIRILDDFYKAKNGLDELDDEIRPLKGAAEYSAPSAGPENALFLLPSDGLPDLRTIPKETYYKVRLITGLLFEHPELCQHLLRGSKGLKVQDSSEEAGLEKADLDLSWMEEWDWDAMAATLWSDMPFQANLETI